MTIEQLFLRGPAGRIECFIKSPPGGPAAAAGVVCHPHPLFGGSMHNKVVHAAAGALLAAGIPVLRFNFRGVGLSDGRHDSGHGEREDLGIVLDHLAERYPGLPLLVAGYSFGAYVGLSVGCADGRVVGLIGIGIPVALYDFSFLRACGKPLALIHGEHDRFGPLPLLMAFAATLPGGARVLPIPAAEHSFSGKLKEVESRVAEAIPAEVISSITR